MKRIHTIPMAMAVASMALNTAMAGDVKVVGASMPSSSEMIGLADTGSTKLRQIKRVDGDTNSLCIVTGQSFTLSTADVAGGYQLGEVFLQSHYAMDFDAFIPDLEIAVYKGLPSNNVLIDTYSFDLTAFGDGTAANELTGGDWVRFSLEGGGPNLTEAGEYTFAVYWADAGTSDTWIWGVRRTTGATDEFTGGAQFVDPFILNADWPDACTNLVEEANRDLHFFISKPLVGNSAPVAVDQDVTTLEDTPLSITLLGSDLDGDDLSFTVEVSPVHGTLTGTVPDMTYTPNPGYVGSDTFSYTANDATTNSAPATVSIEVEADLKVYVGDLELRGTAPSTGDDVVAQNLTISSSGERSIKWQDGTTGGGVGQTFTATKNYAATGIELKMAKAETKFSKFKPDTFILKLFAGGVNSTNVLGTFLFDATDLGTGTVNEWLRFSFGDSEVMLTQGSLYSFLIVNGSAYYRHNTTFLRTTTNGDYVDGSELQVVSPYDVVNFDTDPWDTADPIGNSVVNTGGHLIFSVLGKDTRGPYEAWSMDWGLSGSDTNLTADLEPDGMNNLLEYALGGNPTNNDAAAIRPTTVVEGGFLNYVYNRRNPADPKLTYDVRSSTNLLSGGITNATDYVGASAPVDGIESATNQVSTDVEGKQFMQLNVEFAD